MRKLIWYCSGAGVLAASGFLSLAYYACRCPDSLVGRSMQVIAEASVAMQPLSGLTSLALRTSQAMASADETPGSIEGGIPGDPLPVAPEPAQEPVEEMAQVSPVSEREMDAAPIVIHEDDPMPREAMVPTVPATIEMPDLPGQEIPPNGCPIVMPLCQDDDELPVTPPRMPFAEENDSPRPASTYLPYNHKPAKAQAKKTGDSSEEAEATDFKEWMKLFEEGKKDNSSSVEELPAPTEEEAQDEPKCQEDGHLHEHYSGCPRVTCPYGGKNEMEKNHKRTWDIDPKANKKGKEESSEEPPQAGQKSHSGNDDKSKDHPLPTQGVDTMEYRPSDGGLNEYGPGPLQ